MPQVSAQALRGLAAGIFAALRVPAEEAAWVAELLVRANLAGHDSHGVIRMPQYAQAIRSGQVHPGAPIEIVRDFPSTALVDGHWGLGQVVARRAMELAIEKAKAATVSAVGAYHLYHVGRLSDYTRMASDQDLVGIMLVNGGGASPVVAPFGGAAGRLGTNPIAIAFPTGGSEPFLLDMATSVVAEGHPTTDPRAFYQDPGGAILPLGGSAGHKGFGLAMVVEILSGILARAGYAGAAADRFSNGTFILAIDISAFVDPAEFRAEVDALLRYIKSAPLATGVDAIYAPGEPERLEQQRREREGIPLDDQTWTQLLTLAQELGVAWAAP
jgi:uncharacterized oxidoreductase